MAFDVFISYASKDKIVADAVCARLEASGIRCWIAPRDIVGGTSYGEAIIEAIHGAKVMVLVFSSSANASGHIPKEVERAVSNDVAVLPFRIEDVPPGKSLDYFIGSVHWLDAMTPPMEKHLDNLAATVHKLLPVKPGETAPPTDATVMWQRNAAADAPEHASTVLASAARAAATVPMVDAAHGLAGGGAGSSDGPRAGILNSKMVLIGAAVVLVLAAVIVGMMLMRGGGNSQGAGDAPGATNTAGGNSGASDLNSADNAGSPAPKTPPASHHGSSGGANGGVDPIVGCYQWFNNAPMTIRGDGTMTGGPFTAHWRLVDAGRHAYRFTWPQTVVTLTVAADQRSVHGGNQFGYPASGTRTAGTVGLAGTWRWDNGWSVFVLPDGTFSSGSFRGTWRAVDLSRGLYEMYWPAPVDSVLLLGGGTRISGKNQYGVAISGVKTGACGGN
ncbi:MAG: TIR domain-containing protein [Candidatus Acidiferrales bacterium]